MSRSKERVEIPRFRSSHSEWTGLPLGFVGRSQASTSSLRTRGVQTKEPDPAMKEGLLNALSPWDLLRPYYTLFSARSSGIVNCRVRSSFESEILEDALSEIPLEAVRKHRHDRRRGGQGPRHVACGVGRGAGRAAHQQALGPRQLPYRREGVVVAHGTHLVDERAIERARPEGVADAFHLVGPGRPAAPDRALRLDEDRAHPGLALL